jgi:hypothetical protein
MSSIEVLSSRLAGFFGARPVSQRSSSRVGSVHQFVLQGELRPGNETEYQVDGKDIMVDAGTWIFGDIDYRKTVKVFGVFRDGGLMYAKKIMVLDLL